MAMEKTNKTLLLVPHYGSGEDLIASVASIPDSSNIDLLVVDDGSPNRPVYEELCAVFRATGALHLHLVDHDGYISALNIGLDIASQLGYEFLGRLDAGDVVVGDRFSKQIEFLENHPKVGVVGTWVDFVDETGNHLFTLKHPCENEELQKAIYRFNPFVHPATMIRLSAILDVGGYPTNYPALDDWSCFLKISRKYELANIPEVMLKYEVSPNSVSSKHRFKQSLSKVRLLAANYRPTINQTGGLLWNLAVLPFPRAFLTRIKSVMMR